jgi:hypothetical protein
LGQAAQSDTQECDADHMGSEFRTEFLQKCCKPPGAASAPADPEMIGSLERAAAENDPNQPVKNGPLDQITYAMVKTLQLTLLIAIAAPVLCPAETANEQYLEIGQTCVKAQEPAACMKSYGFQCHQGRLPDKSVEAQALGCNLDLGDGRLHFVQMLYDDSGWNIETEHSYWPEYSDVNTPEEDSYLALTSYIRHEMEDYSTYSSGGGSIGSELPLSFETGDRRIDGRVAVRAICAVVFGLQLDETASTETKSFCESNLLRTVKKLSQPQAKGPYRVAGPSDFDWEHRTTTLVSGESALVWEGRYAFTEKHVPCQWISDCCSPDGHFYLDSCRAPTKSELGTINTCLAEEGTHHSEKFFECLRTAGVKVGCENQADGSQICY